MPVAACQIPRLSWRPGQNNPGRPAVTSRQTPFALMWQTLLGLAHGDFNHRPAELVVMEDVAQDIA